MSLPMLVNSADCGPINPLQGLSKRLDQDRGIQQDHFGAGRAGSSKETFRTQYSAAAGVSQDASRFFSGAQSPPPLAANAPIYDFAALHASLPPAHAHSPALTPAHQPRAATAAWAADFLQQPARPSHVSQHPSGPVAQQEQVVRQDRGLYVKPQYASPSSMHQGFIPWSPPMAGYSTGTLSPMRMAAQPPGRVMSPSMSHIHASQLDEAFQSQEASLGSAFNELGQQLQEYQPQAAAAPKSQDASELARTAGLLIDTVKHEQNPKFQKSQFLGLMRQVRDGDIVVDGNEMVPTNEAAGNTTAADWVGGFQASVDLKGKGRAMSPGTAIPNPEQTTLMSHQNSAFSQLMQHREPESEIDAYLRQENEDYIKLTSDASKSSTRDPNGRVAMAQELERAMARQQEQWGALQQQLDHMRNNWNTFEATATGVRPVTMYQFQQNNPYFLGEASMNRHHMIHADERDSLYESVLEFEAATQRDPANALRWFELGVKQQENEREQKAIQALQRALELDPMHLLSWLALAVSYTNDNNRVGAYGAIREWAERNERYRDAVQHFHATNPDVDTTDASQSEKFDSLIRCLIEMVRTTGGEVDADAQIALAVLLNTNEEYEKARDCFNAALAVRPEDWLLYNRVGATLANSGQPEGALQYYYRALELNPVYIRARFNLGISCINLRRYDEAAQNILDALILQDGDTVHEPNTAEEKRGVTSSTLWDSLKTCCLHMQRIDLATLCDRQDLETFRLNFLL